MKDKDDGKYDYVDTIEFDKYSIDTEDTLKEYQRKYHNKIYPSEKFSNVYKIEKL